MGERIPTTAEVRERFIDGFPMDTWAVARDECGQDFDRWLATVRAEALREAAGAWSDWDALEAPEDWLRARADRIEREAGLTSE